MMNQRPVSRGRLHASMRSHSGSSLDGEDPLLDSSLSKRKLAPLRPTSAAGQAPLGALNPLPSLPTPKWPPSPAESPVGGFPSSFSARPGSEESVPSRRGPSPATADSKTVIDLRQQLEATKSRIETLEASNSNLRAEGDRRERVLEALLKQARVEKQEAQRKAAAAATELEAATKAREKAVKELSGATGGKPGGKPAAAASSATANAYKMQIDAYKSELGVKDKQIAALRYELEQRPAAVVSGPVPGGLEDEDDDDDGGFEAVLREEMETMRAAYERRLADMKEKLDQVILMLKRQGEDVTALPTPRLP